MSHTTDYLTWHYDLYGCFPDVWTWEQIQQYAESEAERERRARSTPNPQKESVPVYYPPDLPEELRPYYDRFDLNDSPTYWQARNRKYKAEHHTPGLRFVDGDEVDHLGITKRKPSDWDMNGADQAYPNENEYNRSGRGE